MQGQLAAEYIFALNVAGVTAASQAVQFVRRALAILGLELAETLEHVGHATSDARLAGDDP